jgi:hypothetical protein
VEGKGTGREIESVKEKGTVKEKETGIEIGSEIGICVGVSAPGIWSGTAATAVGGSVLEVVVVHGGLGMVGGVAANEAGVVCGAHIHIRSRRRYGEAAAFLVRVAGGLCPHRLV